MTLAPHEILGVQFTMIRLEPKTSRTEYISHFLGVKTSVSWQKQAPPETSLFSFVNLSVWFGANEIVLEPSPADLMPNFPTC